jgi:hypothetical protein
MSTYVIRVLANMHAVQPFIASFMRRKLDEDVTKTTSAKLCDLKVKTISLYTCMCYCILIFFTVLETVSSRQCHSTIHSRGI